METLSRPLFCRNDDQTLRYLFVCNPNYLQNLAPAKGFFVNELVNGNKLGSPCQRRNPPFWVT